MAVTKIVRQELDRDKFQTPGAAYLRRRAETRRLLGLIEKSLQVYDEQQPSRRWDGATALESVIAGLARAAHSLGALDDDEMEELVGFFE